MEAEQRALSREERYRSFFATTEPRLRRALIAAYGPELGSDATAEALTWAWEHFERIETMPNPAGYLWRVGQTSVRSATRRRDAGRVGLVREVDAAPVVEPGLAAELARLTVRQRTAVLLVHGFGYSLAEAGSQMGCRVRTVRNHLDRGMARLRAGLGVTDDA